jgi:hypothetical protein
MLLCISNLYPMSPTPPMPSRLLLVSREAAWLSSAVPRSYWENLYPAEVSPGCAVPAKNPDAAPSPRSGLLYLLLPLAPPLGPGPPSYVVLKYRATEHFTLSPWAARFWLTQVRGADSWGAQYPSEPSLVPLSYTSAVSLPIPTASWGKERHFIPLLA